MWLIGFVLILEKQATINYSGKLFKKLVVQDEAYDNMLFVDDEALRDLYQINFRKVVLLWKISGNKEGPEFRVQSCP